MNSVLEQLLDFCNKSELTILSVDLNSHVIYNKAVVQHKCGRVEDLYHTKGEWDFE